MRSLTQFCSRGEEWGEFLHLPGQKFFDFSEIRAEIQRETDRVTGKNKGISNKSINLRIYSPYVLNLTLVDLPGITKVPTGDQPEDVEQQILSMCMEFISNPNAIILAVSAANQDLANSEGLKLARSVDPEGVRTIGVLTKVDIMDHGTDCSDILDNKVIPLRRGYVAVMNRSQKDINDNISIRKGLQKEQAFFQAHQNYRTMLTRCGTKNLSRTLNQMLMHHIRDCLPQIRNKVNSLLSNVTRDLNSLGECIDDQGASAKGAILLRILSQFASNFANHIEGKGGPNNEFSDMTELYGGARISHIFNEIYGKIIKSVDPFEGLTDEDIRTAIANANGIRPSLFVPEISFDLLVKRQIARLEQPGLQCADLVMEEMQRMIGQSETLELSRFPDLRDRTIEIVNQLLKNCVIPTQNMIANMVLIEKAYINTSHPDFIGGKAAVTTAQQSRKLASNPDGRDGRNGINAIVNNENALNDPNAGNSGKVPFSPPATPGQPNAGGFMSFFQSPSGAKPGAGSYRNSANMSNPGKDEFFGGIRLPQVPDRMRCNSVPTDRER